MRAARRAARAAALSLAAFLLAAAPPLAAGPPPAAAAARSPFLEPARAAAAKGDWAGAGRIAAEGLSLDGLDADLRYLAALAALEGGGDLRFALASLDAGLASGRFAAYEPAAALRLRAALLVRTRSYERALADLRSLGAAAGPAGAEDARLSALALFGLGRRADAMAELARAARRHPDDPRLARLFFERAGAAPAAAAERALADLFLGRLRSLAEVDPELLVLAAPLMAAPAARRDAVLAFRALGRGSARASLLALEYGILGEEAAVAEIFSGGDLASLDLELVADLPKLLGSEKGGAALESALAAFSGSLLADRDHDGWREESTRYRRGLIASWRLDADQDGADDLEADFSQGLPASLTFSLMGATVGVEYADYPHAAKIRFQDKPGISVEYRFAPEAFPLPVLALEPLGGRREARFHLARRSGTPAPTERAAAGLALLRLSSGPAGEEIAHLEAGIPLRVDRRREGRPYSTLEFSKGRPGVEYVDADGDGRFETERYREPPTLASEAADPADESSVRWLRIDADGDGLFEYREETIPPRRKEWDFDANGSFDAVEYQLPDGGRVREFSSRFDGRFDEALRFDSGGKLVGVTRDGKALALLADANPRLLWIGEKPFDLGSNLPSAEGVYRYMNRSYRLVFAAGQAFAELVP
ncbi:MAG: hypothetical protein JNG85_02370 [Spirochaetaceae bacterium]|nr:hypothetical protein [Spirochaetaceae bacterium]